MQNECNVLEVLDFTIAGLLNDVIAVLNDIPGVSIAPLDFACTAEQLSGGPSCTEPGAFPSDCTGNLGSLERYGVYSKGCPVQRRLLCQQEVRD